MTEQAGTALQTVARVATDVLSHLDLESALLSVVNAALDLHRADIVGILLADESDDVLRMRACAGHRTISTARLTVRRGQGVAGRVFESGRSFKTDDYLSDASITRDFFAIAEKDGTRSALGAPMTVRGKVIGALMVWSRRAGAFGDADIHSLINLANLATIAVENARLYETERAAVRTLAEANRQLEEQYALLQRAACVHEELTQLVLEGGALSGLVRMVAKHTRGTVAILDPALEVLATSAGAGALTGRARRYLRHLREPAGRGDLQAQGTLTAPGSSFDHWLLVREVVAGGERLAHLCVDVDRPPGSLDRVIVEQASIVCALQLTKERAVTEARTRVRSDFLWDLLEGNVTDDSEALVRARYLGYCLPPRLRVALIPVNGLDEWARRTGANADAVGRRRESLVRAAERLGSGAGPSPTFAARRGSLIAMVLPASEAAADTRRVAERMLEGLEAANPDLTFSAGISACVPLSANLGQTYRQAQHALSAIPVVASGRRVVAFDELGVLQFLLAPTDRKELVGFARKVLGPAMDYDRDHNADLVRTVEVYLASDCNLQRTAEQLYVHPKTVRYRLDRVEQLAGICLAAQQDRFDAQLALTMIRALSLSEAAEA